MPNEEIFNRGEIRLVKDDGFYGVTKPVMFRLYDTTAQTAANWTAPFFIADRPYYILSVTERHGTAATNADTAMLNVVPSGTAPSSGTNALSTGLLLNTTANTNQSGSLSTVSKARTLNRGDSLALVTTGTLAALKGVTISVVLRSN
jgi:hypothetical protein